MLGVRDAAVEAGVVGTVGVLRVLPGVPSIVPGRVELEAEIRGLDEAALDGVEARLGELASGLGGELQRATAKASVRSDPELVAGSAVLIWRPASMPFNSGMPISSTTTSGFKSRA